MSTTPSRHASVTSLGTVAARRRRPAEFLLPDGRKILVALPEEAAYLREKYRRAADAPDAVQVEVVVHGSEEHAGYLRQTREHHTATREELRKRYGADFEEWEQTQARLDEVQRQLDGIADYDAQNALNANFEKFGYGAALRTYGEDGTVSGTVTPGAESDSDSTSQRDWSDRRGGKGMRLFRRPIVKQYFHRGLLWRSSEETKVMSFELFFDLLYVGILALNGDHAAETPDGAELLRFVITFVMSWKIWSDVQQGVSWFDIDDAFQRVSILILIACLLGFTTNILEFLGDDHDTYTLAVSFYLAARLYIAAWYGLTGALLPHIIGVMLCQIIGVVIPSTLWIASIHVEMPNRLVLIWVALFLDLASNAVIVTLFRFSRNRESPLARKIDRFFEFYPAVNIEHKVERTNAFVTLVIGYGVVGVLYQNAHWGVNAFLGKAVMGLVQAYIFNWLYFEIDGENIHMHAIRRRVDTAWIWQYAHIPFVCAYTLSAAALSRLVLAADCPDTDADSLTEAYHAKSEEEVALGLRFFYCTGMGIALFFMGIISLTHDHKIGQELRIPKLWRLANRLVVCIILFCLPAAEHLNSLQLISITMCLMIWVLLVEIVGCSRHGEQIWGDPESMRLSYRAKCSKKEFEKAMMSGGGELDIAELGKGEKTAIDIAS